MNQRNQKTPAERRLAADFKLFARIGERLNFTYPDWYCVIRTRGGLLAFREGNTPQDALRKMMKAYRKGTP